MTREEAMSKVRGYLTDYLPSEDDGELEEILKALEQESKSDVLDKWHTELPKKDGRYLIWQHSQVEIAWYADNLYTVDDYNFEDKKGCSGWYKYDSEYGYYELDDVKAWQELPADYIAKSEGKE